MEWNLQVQTYTMNAQSTPPYMALDFETHIGVDDMPDLVRRLQGFPCVYACFVFHSRWNGV